MSEKFKYTADEVLKLLDRGDAVIMFRDGLGGVTVLLARSPSGGDMPHDWPLDKTVREWSDYNSDLPVVPDTASDRIKTEAIRASIFLGPDGLSGCGVGPEAVSQALHSLTEKVTRKRIPNSDKAGSYHYLPRKYRPLASKATNRKPR